MAALVVGDNGFWKDFFGNSNFAPFNLLLGTFLSYFLLKTLLSFLLGCLLRNSILFSMTDVSLVGVTLMVYSLNSGFILFETLSLLTDLKNHLDDFPNYSLFFFRLECFLEVKKAYTESHFGIVGLYLTMLLILELTLFLKSLCISKLYLY